MPLWERLFHSLVFEAGAAGLSAAAVWLLPGSHSGSTALAAGVAMSLIAMLWNLVFNYVFDQCFRGRRELRSWRLRIGHTVGFEGGLMLFTVPVLMYALDIGWQAALLADLGLTLLIMLYTLLFNWAYDHLRLRWWAK